MFCPSGSWCLQQHCLLKDWRSLLLPRLVRIDGTGTLKRIPGLLSVEMAVPLKEDSSSGSAVLAICLYLGVRLFNLCYCMLNRIALFQK